jgi:acetolactate synthase-1/3 small subunit
MKRIISILLENESGALSRVVGLFAQRGYNIDTLTVAPTDDDTLSRLNLTTQGDDQMAEQIVKQLHKLIDTIKVVDLTVGSHIERELMLVKIKASDAEVRAELKSCVEIFRGHVVDVTASTYTVQLTGDSDKLDAFIDAVREIGIMEVVRTGVSGIARGDKFLRV